MKEVIVEYINAHGTPLTFCTGYFEDGGAGYDTQSDATFIRVWSPSATTLFQRSRVVCLTGVESNNAPTVRATE